MEFLQYILYFIVTLGILVFVHELGHFLAAKLCRMRVERFSIGFPPRAFGKKIGETDYCVSYIPLGGYVKISGMIDESFDSSYASTEVQPYEFRAKPAWQKVFVLSAGVLMNILLAIAIFWVVNLSQGRSVRETTLIGFVDPESPAAQAGFVAGDRVQSVNGEQVGQWDLMLGTIFLESMAGDVSVAVLRNGSGATVTVPRGSVPETSPTAFGLIAEQTEIVISTVLEGRPADQLGLERGDVIVRMNGEPMGSDRVMLRTVRANAGKELSVEWQRNGEMLRGSTTVGTDGLIGVQFDLVYRGPRTVLSYTVLGAVGPAVQDVVNVVAIHGQQVGNIFSGRTPLRQSVGGPIRIAQIATQQAEMGLIPFLYFMALLSVSLALLNILPIPALDGGHIVLVLVEAVLRREIPVKVKLSIQRVGFVLIMALIVLVFYNDLSGIFRF